MLVSFVIPAYNAARYLAETLQSIQAQTRTHWEAIVVDDGSRDATSEVAQQFADQDARIRLIRQTNAGVSVARNTGYAHAHPESQYIFFLDADDLLEPDALEALMNLLETRPEAVGAHGLRSLIDSKGCPLPMDEQEMQFRKRFFVQGEQLLPCAPEQPTTFESLVYFNYIQTGTLLARRDALERAGLFEPGRGMCEDWDVCLRLSLQGAILFLNQEVLRYRRHEQNVTRHGAVMIQGARYVRRKLYAASPPERRQMLLEGYRQETRYILRQQWRIAGENLRRGNMLEALKRLRHFVRVYFRFTQDRRLMQRMPQGERRP
jgi:glycosyltransferase involved in cell wall biosynthesis